MWTLWRFSFRTTFDLSSGQMLSVLLLRVWCFLSHSQQATLSNTKSVTTNGTSPLKKHVSSLKVNIQTMDNVKQNLILEKDDNFIKFGNFNDQENTQSKIFYPRLSLVCLRVVRPSVLSKACAQLGRELDPCQHYQRNWRGWSYWWFPSGCWWNVGTTDPLLSLGGEPCCF